MTGGIVGRRAVLRGSDDAPTPAIIAALGRAGTALVDLDGSPVDLVVHVAACRGVERALGDVDEDTWERAAEAPARELLATMQAAHSALAAASGRLVVVLPAAALEGAAGLVAETTGWEAMRLLAKSAARRWASDGISVNVVATRLEQPGDAARTDPALGARHRDDQAVADAVVLLAGDGGRLLTGSTLVIDGGALMLP